LDKPMSEAALRARVSDPQAGWTWDLVSDSLQSLGLSVQLVPCTLDLLTQTVEPVLVRLKSGGCAALLPSHEWDEPMVMWPARSGALERCDLGALMEASAGLCMRDQRVCSGGIDFFDDRL
jgi:hypothetical protein